MKYEKINLQFFAQVIDLSEKLSEEKSVITIKGDTYEINDGFKTILEVDALMKNKNSMSQVEQLSRLFIVLFGAEKGQQLLDKNYKLSFYKHVLATALNILKDGDDTKK